MLYSPKISGTVLFIHYHYTLMVSCLLLVKYGGDLVYFSYLGNSETKGGDDYKRNPFFCVIYSNSVHDISRSSAVSCNLSILPQGYFYRHSHFLNFQ